MKKTIVFQGDSITDMVRPTADDRYFGSGYANMVVAELNLRGEQNRYYNRGISGNRSTDVLARVRCDLINLQPDVLSILMGINDIFHELELQNGVSAPYFDRVYRTILDMVLEELPYCRILLLEPFVIKGCWTDDPPQRWDYISRHTAEYAAIVKQIATDYGAVFVPLQDVLNEAVEKLGFDNVRADGVHPNAGGAKLIANEWIKAYDTL